MEQNKPHSGDLLQDSPALAGVIKRNLSASVLPVLAEAYRWSFEHGGCHEEIIVRTQGMSFNPRAARVTQLLATEAKVRELPALVAAMLACARELPAGECPFSDAFAIALAAQEFRNSPASKDIGPHAQIALALELDFVRHLHIAIQDPIELESALERAGGIVAATAGVDSLGRLHLMLRSARQLLLDSVANSS